MVEIGLARSISLSGPAELGAGTEAGAARGQARAVAEFGERASDGGAHFGRSSTVPM